VDNPQVKFTQILGIDDTHAGEAAPDSAIDPSFEPVDQDSDLEVPVGLAVATAPAMAQP
jgi:hypothetical protein